MSHQNFFKELKRRNVYRVAITYAVVAWVLIQVASILLPTFEAPAWVMKALTLILIIGFPVALVLAWAFELTPEGIKHTTATQRSDLLTEGNRKRRIISKGLMVTILIIIAGQFFYSKYWIQKKDTGNTEKSIAVLPLTNLNINDEDLSYFSVGVSQEIVDELAKIKSLKVSAFTQSSYYSRNDLDPKEIADHLGVQYLISGTARLLDNEARIKLSIELFNPFTNDRLWHNTFEEPMSNAYSIQNIIARKVAESLDIEFGVSEVKPWNDSDTDNGEAFRLYLRAKSELNKGTNDGYKTALVYLEQAIDLDTEFNRAHTLIAWNYVAMNTYDNIDQISSKEVYAKAMPHIEKSISLDPKSSDIYLVSGGLKLFYGNRIQDAIEDIDMALKLKSWPRIPTDYCICAAISAYVALNDVDRASEISLIAQEVDPGNILINWDKANIYLVKGEYEKVRKELETSYELTDGIIGAIELGRLYYHMGDFKKAIEYLEKWYSKNYKMPLYTIAYLSIAYEKLGDQESGQRYYQELLQRQSQGEPNIYWALAMISISREQYSEALDYLEKSFHENESSLAFITSIDPIFKPLYEEPRFMEIRKKMQFYD